MAVPKKKTAKSYSKTRHSTWKQLQQKKLLDRTKIVTDKETGEPRRSHCVNPETGRYKGRVVVNKTKKTETTRIQA